MEKPRDRDDQILIAGLLLLRGGVGGPTPDSNLSACGFDSHRPCPRPRQKRQLLPGLQTSTAETVRCGNLIIRLSACFYERGRANEPTRATRTRAC